ncbi:glycosyltransferase [Candidatus Mancarchaeum acidiphilum]|nr:glycosyltransferase [Candidatus Mancarchaeum acidiphilum]
MITTIDDIVAAYNVAWASVNTYNLYPMLRSSKATDDPTEKELNTFRKEYWGKLDKMTILVPAYKEQKTLYSCVKAINESSYPKSKLEVIILLEKDDTSTIEVANRIASKFKNVKSIVVEDEVNKKGKPRALNYGLKMATGDVIGILDAEDMVSKDAFIRTAYMMQNKDYGVVQGILDMVNEGDGWKNLMLRAEYGYWFNTYLKALKRADYPLPFGGTTNFFRKDTLQKLGGWDSNNLTEDFELGMKIFANNSKIRENVRKNAGKLNTNGNASSEDPIKLGIIRSVTREESPPTMKGWMRQRTRWQQGKIQTLRKEMNDDQLSLRTKAHIFFSSVQPHISVINLTGIGISVYAYLDKALSLPVEIVAGFNAVMVAFYATMNAAGYLWVTKPEKETIKYRHLKAVVTAVTLPAYWAMQWVADMKALKLEYIDKSNVWYKTEHFGRHIDDRQLEKTLAEDMHPATVNNSDNK